MKLAELGETALIERLTRHLRNGPEVRAGVGDDCAVIGGARAARWDLLKTDCVVEGVHFTPEEDRTRVGWKALCRALSDVAAMSGVPAQALVTVAAQPSTEVAQLLALYRGLEKAARRFGVSIVGGETSRSPGPLFISVALTGWVERARCVRRSGGKQGDAIYVTGRLGGSRAGKHLDFTPRLVEARWLTEGHRISAMMDLSDGLASDVPKLARASGCGFELWEEAIPCTRGCTLAEAQCGGEDYELLFTVAAGRCARLTAGWKKKFPKLPLHQIGVLTRLRRGTRTAEDGFNHFP